MAVPTFIGTAVPSGNPTTGGTLTIPSSVQTGDDLFLAVTSRDASGSAPTVTDNDTGGNTWTKIGSSTDQKATLWYKKATSGTASKTVTVASAVGSCAFALDIYRRGNTSVSTPYGTVSVETNASGNETHAAYTPHVSDSVVLGIVFNYANDNAVTGHSCSGLSGFSQDVEKLSTGGNDCGVNIASGSLSGSPTAVGPFTWTQTDGATYSMMVSLSEVASGTSYTETGLAQTVLFTNALNSEQLNLGETGRAQTVLFTQTRQTDTATFVDTSKVQTVLFTQNRTDVAAFVETEKSQTVLFTQSGNGGLTYTETNKVQTVLFSQVGTDTASFSDISAQTVLFTQNRTDIGVFGETGKSQTILFSQNRTDAASFTDTGKSQTVLFTQSSTDARFVTEASSQTLLFTQSRTDVASFVETAKSQTVLFSQQGSDNLVGGGGISYDETGKPQTLLLSQAATDFRAGAEITGTTVLFGQAGTGNVSFSDTAKAQTVLFSQAGSDLANFSYTGLDQTILFITGGEDSVPPAFGTFVAVTNVVGRSSRTGITIRGGA